jgi:phage terminase large subunit GpA-like protein
MASYTDSSVSQVKEYSTLKDIIVDLSEVLLPPERISVSDAAAKYRTVYNPPAYVGKWDNYTVPYMREVMDTLESREYTAVCVVSAAQSAKTELSLNWLTYNIVCDPSDFMVVEKSQTEAKNFSMMKVDRTIRHSPEVGQKLIERRTANNTFDKRFKSGTFLTMTWPTINALSGKTVRRVALSDYDRMDQDVGGEGSPFDLARRRTSTFKRLGMTYVESSPSYDVLNPRWRPATAHEAPPTEGILGIYNRGDRRRRYWQCPHCSDWFEPSFSTLRWPESDDPMESAENVFMACPHCFEENGAAIFQSQRNDIDQNGVWLRDGETIDKDGTIGGKPRRSDIASYWIKGPGTAFGQWKNLVLNYLLAMQEYDSTGNDRPLKATVNTDQGEAYTPPRVAEVRAPEDLMGRAEDIGDCTIPTDVRFLIASIDVQKNRFVVQVQGIVPAGEKFDIAVIDRFEIRKSKRFDEDGDRYMVNPGSYLEDWNLITEQVLDRTYMTQESTPRKMSIKLTLCDSGGKEGVTSNAYDYYRELRSSGYGNRFQLVKGESSPSAPRVRRSFPDSGRKDRKAAARGEIPVLMLNTDRLKDWLDNALGRMEPGGYYIRFPDWLELNFYKELCAEVRLPNGKWDNSRKLRNESTDLTCYCYAGCIHLRVERINWDDPPNWADEWDHNPMVVDAEAENPAKPSQGGDDALEELKKLAGDLA